MIRTFLFAALPLTLLLGSCGAKDDARRKELAELDENLAGKGADPVVKGAIEDRILVDPQLTGSSNANAVRAATVGAGSVPADTGHEGSTASAEELDAAKLMHAPEAVAMADEDCAGCDGKTPQTLGARADYQARRGKGTCEAKLQYGASWANRLPPEFPVYPRARVQEAGGVENGLCDIRAVTFTTSARLKDVVDWYYTRARRSGFDAEYVLRGGSYMLGGTRDVDDGAYVLTLTERRDGGTAVDMVVSNGR